MTHTITSVVVFALALAHPLSSLAQEAKKEGSDPVQGLTSPFQVGSGATFLVTQEKKSLTASFTGQLIGRAFNVWQLGFTGTTNDEGESLSYSTAETDAPGFKAKIGFGHSSFLATPTTDYTAQAAQFLNQAWCLDVLTEINKTLPVPVTSKGAACQPYFVQLKESLEKAPPKDEEVAKVAKAVIATLGLIVSNITAENRTAACGMFKDAAKSVYKFCLDSGEPQKSAEDQHRAYPALYDSIVKSQLPSFYYTFFGNYQPTLSSAAYREAADLATKHQWTQLLHGVTLDSAFFYKSFAGGLQLGYVESAEISLVSVCKVTTNGDYRAEKCKDAMLGKPDPDQAFITTVALALDPLVMPSSSSFARPGAQFEVHYERPSSGKGTKTQYSLPLFLAPVSAPLKLVVGVRPTWMRDTTGDDPDRHFSVFFFIGARPRVGS